MKLNGGVKPLYADDGSKGSKMRKRLVVIPSIN